MTSTFWQAWHDRYEDPTSYLSRRLAVVQRRVRERLSAAPPGAISVVSACAGHGRDLLEVLVDHPRRGDVVARLIELDDGNAAVARASAGELGLPSITVVTGDASTTDAYQASVPADLVLLCGVFGNVVDADIERTIAVLPGLCARGASVIWTRHRQAPDLTPTIREWFVGNGFEESSFDAPEDVLFTVGVNTFIGEPQPFAPGVRMFEFVEVG